MFGYMLEEFKKKSLKIDCANMKNRKNKSVFEKIHSTYSSFHQHVKRLQSLINGRFLEDFHCNFDGK